MTPRLLRFGHAASPVVIVDDCLPDPVQFVAAAVAMAPLPSAEGSYYPGLRRVFAENDQPAWMMTTELLDNVAPYIAGAFDCDGFTLTEASFSLVTLPPDRLIPAQRHPHFDSTDPDVVAAILYLFDAGMDDGTAFYRHAATAIEVVA
ncbi:MAG: hypothetical protein KGM49_14555, partial [Sphingomonadales bacterium]|nr:hypothetical protein [Sphingomonadales bacterium]